MARAETRTFYNTVADCDSGRLLLEFCQKAWPTYKLQDWLEILESGDLLVNGRTASGRTVLSGGDTIQCTVKIGAEPSVRKDYRIVYRDDDFAVVDKPGNLPCHPAGRYYGNTLEQLLSENENFPNIHFVNRLDRETSGIVVVALRSDAASRLGKAFMRREVKRKYIAAVEGKYPEGARNVAGWLYLARGTTVRRKRVFVPGEGERPPEGQSVETTIRWLTTCGDVSWVECTPKTGRPHQIRATLKGLGFPIVGDKLYGVDETIYARMTSDKMTALDRSRLRIPRQALHAYRITFRHPRHQCFCTFTAPMPEDLML
jgi:23S rRNA pseudouridine955/2504/2580 synthase/23S rRNA pseudouridine1911/1915/1917 synthase